jgi:FemAB-related protein (PEP-CTERM system-associated)
VALADELNVDYLELRHEEAVSHPALTECVKEKVHMRLPLPGRPGELWDRLSPKVRNQVRKGQKGWLQAQWGRDELHNDFYGVFSQNMRDLGTPVYGRSLFQNILRQFPEQAEICVVRAENKPVAAALLLHGWGVTEVPSASSLRAYSSTCANMLMYWQLLERAILRGQSVFDFGRSSADSNTYRFKKQWGALAETANWQYYVRRGSIAAARVDNPRYKHLIRLWQHLPVWLTRLIGPAIVRGIP